MSNVTDGMTEATRAAGRTRPDSAARRIARTRFLDWRDRARARIDRARGFPRLRAEFEARVGYPLDLTDPESFNAKIQWRKIHDRNPLHPVVADKYRMRQWLTNHLGAARAEALLVPLHRVTDRPADLDLSGLPEGLVIKPNHASRMLRFRYPGKPFDLEEVRLISQLWLLKQYGSLRQEWAYWPIPRRIMVEELMPRADGSPADDVKIICFHGKPAYVMAEFNRFNGAYQVGYTPDGGPLGIFNKGDVPRVAPPPPHLARMMELAEEISAPFDHVRVDFLTNGTDFALNELSLYRGSGMNRFVPESYDFDMGALWTLPGRG